MDQVDETLVVLFLYALKVVPVVTKIYGYVIRRIDLPFPEAHLRKIWETGI